VIEPLVVVTNEDPSLVKETCPSPVPPTTGLGLMVVEYAFWQGGLMFAVGALFNSRFMSCAAPVSS
jgi:hypothetical protein